jgi:hypothetical protein
METRIPIPKDWQAFERLCHKLWSQIWGDPNALRHGRSGQPQAGVDVFGKQRGRTLGVQCKDKSVESHLSVGELDAECVKAETFRPRLSEFTVATTDHRDVSVQARARELSESFTHNFDVYVWSWEEIEEEIRMRPTLLAAYYPNFVMDLEEPSTGRMTSVTHKDQFTAFFSRPEIDVRIPAGLREYLLPFCHELSDNAYRHGGASTFGITCEDSSIALEDNGVAFDPLTQLEPEKANLQSHIGSYVFDSFKTQMREHLTMTYERLSSGRNRLLLQFNQPTRLIFRSPPVEVGINLDEVFERDGAARMAAAIPFRPDAETVINVQSSFGIALSALASFLSELQRRLPEGSRVRIYLPREPYLESITSWFRDERITLLFR